MAAGFDLYDSPVDVSALETPCALIARDVLERNLKRVANMANDRGVLLRPHAKTHKSAWIAHKQVRLGAAGVTVSKVSEAEALVAAGLRDVLVAYPIVTPSKIDRLLRLSRLAHVATLVEDLEGARRLAASAIRDGASLSVWVDVDTGLDRIGAPLGPELGALVNEVRTLPGLELQGLSTHEGHVYKQPDTAVRAQLARTGITGLIDAARSLGIERVSAGATPTMLDVLDLDGLTDARPGNYVFYDAMQVALGTVPLEDCALSLLVTCVSHRGPNKAMVDAGSKALSSDTGAHGSSQVTGYGIVKSRPDLAVTGLSEEHGWLNVDPDGERLSVGQQLEIIPNHSCATMANFDFAHLVADGMALGRVETTARGCMT